MQIMTLIDILDVKPYSIFNDEKPLSFPCSDAVAVFGTNAVWILHAGAICDDDCMWRDGLSVLSA